MSTDVWTRLGKRCPRSRKTLHPRDSMGASSARLKKHARVSLTFLTGSPPSSPLVRRSNRISDHTMFAATGNNDHHIMYISDTQQLSRGNIEAESTPHHV